MNELKTDYSGLVKAYGQANVENTVLFIENQLTLEGIKVCVSTSPEMVKALLYGIHGRNAMYTDYHIYPGSGDSEG